MVTDRYRAGAAPNRYSATKHYTTVNYHVSMASSRPSHYGGITLIMSTLCHITTLSYPDNIPRGQLWAKTLNIPGDCPLRADQSWATTSMQV